jgi:hypothetical protein
MAKQETQFLDKVEDNAFGGDDETNITNVDLFNGCLPQ